MHSLVENYGDCGMDEEIEAVKREWWNVVTENSWEYLAGEKEKFEGLNYENWNIDIASPY